MMTKALTVPAPGAPRVLLCCTFPWATVGRLAIELNALGAHVDAIAPRRSVAHRLSAVEHHMLLGRPAPVRDLRRAISATRPDLIVPCDDRTRRALNLLYAKAGSASSDDREVRRRIRASLGSPSGYSLVYSRAAILRLAASRGVRVPPSQEVSSLAQLQEWHSRWPGPAVLKVDGSAGGRQLRLIATADEAERGWEGLSRQPSVPRVMKWFAVDADPWPLRAGLAGVSPRVSVQRYVAGVPGTIAVTCRNGAVLGAVAARVVRSQDPTGPATVVEMVDHPEMERAAAVVIGELRMSGLCGLDFILDESGDAHLLELNPRATPTAHLAADCQSDPLGALMEALWTGRACARPCARPVRLTPGPMVALFPQELERDPDSPYLQSAYHDVPLGSPEFIRFATNDRTRLKARRSAVRPLPDVGSVLPNP